jgi:hypothetical protein
MGKLHLIFSKDLEDVMLVYTHENGVRFTIDGKEIELDQWKVQSLIQILVDYDKGVK